MVSPASRSEFRLFISSTFLDLQAERAYLMKHVFPKVRAACRERGIEFTEIDLLWGVTEEEASLGRVIRTCLEEIDRCHPYFIAIIGDRYGWIPPISEVQKDYQLIERYPWIEDAAIDGLSLVEIEIMAGLLNNPAGATGSFVYCRKPDPSVVPNPQLATLRERIGSSGRPVRSFDSLDELGESVYEDLLVVLERDWPLASGVSELEAERRLQQNFASTRRRAYIANPKQTQVLHDHVAADLSASRGPLVVHGLSGAGKSALMAYFAFHYQRANPEAFVITHFVGASPSGSSAHTILRHIALEIRDRLGLTEELPATREKLEEAFPSWLARVPGELLIVIDAVNQLPEPDNLLGWLPEHWPPNVHLIVTSTPCESLTRLQKLAWAELEIGPLTAKEREAIIVRFLGEYRKSLSQHQLDVIARDPKSSSPLFLRTLLEELRIAADNYLLEETIEHYLGARDLDELFQFVLERMESDYGADLVSSILGFIAASRRGLSEPELIELTHVDRTKLSVLLLALDYHLMKPNGRFTFFHDYLRRAVHRRYLANPLIERERHRKLGVFFGRHTMMVRRFDEEPWQWNACGDKRRLAASLAKLDLLKYAIDNQRQHDILKYWKATDRSPKEYYTAALGEIAHDPGTYPTAALDVSKLLATMSDYETAETLAREALGVCERAVDPDHIVLGNALRQLGWILKDRGKLDEAESRLRQALELAETQNDKKGIEESISQLAGLLYLRSNHAEAVALVQRALASGDGSRSSAEHRDLIVNLSVALSGLGKIDEAEELLRNALAQCERLEGRTTDFALLANNLGTVLYNKPGANLDEALALFRVATDLNKSLLGARHPYTLQNITNLAVILQLQGKYEEAEPTYIEAIPMLETVNGPSHPNVLALRHNFALLRSNQGRFDEARAMLLDVIAKAESAFGPDHLTTIQFHIKLARNELRAGRRTDAFDLYSKYVPLQDDRLGADHPQARLTRAEFAAAFPEMAVPHSA